jgi:hypothetical protein
MNYQERKIPANTISRDLRELTKETNNIYLTVNIIGKRANQLTRTMKYDLKKKLDEFSSYSDNLEEVFENREQIEISKFYERLPKPTLLAIDELLKDELFWRLEDKSSNEE